MKQSNYYHYTSIKTLFSIIANDELWLSNLKNSNDPNEFYLTCDEYNAYGKMREGCIYLRNGDKNTPDNGNADIEDIENLWRKRLGLTKPPLEIIFDRMHNKLEWTEQDDVFYNIYRPEYVIEIINDAEDDLEAEFYAYAMTNSNTSYRNLNIKYQSTILDSYQLVILDGGRLQIPVPEWGYVCHNDYGINAKYCYKYYIAGTRRYRLLSFLYDEQNSDERFAFMHLNDVVLHYHSDDEKLAFESFVEGHQEIFEKYLNGTNRYNHINTGELTKTYDLTGERIHGDYDYIGHIDPKQVLLWIFNPFYERFYKEAADENDTSLEQIRNVLSSIAFWEYINDDIDKKIRDEMISNYLSHFKLVLAELINCNISDESKSKIKEIKAKLFKYEKTTSP